MAFDNRINRRIFSRMGVGEKLTSLLGGILTACLLTLFLFLPTLF
jgi:hypothetical protein